jgi:hypothetical protein
VAQTIPDSACMQTTVKALHFVERETRRSPAETTCSSFLLTETLLVRNLPPWYLASSGALVLGWWQVGRKDP